MRTFAAVGPTGCITYANESVSPTAKPSQLADVAVALAVTSQVAGLFEDLAGHSASAYTTYVLIGLALATCQSSRPVAAS